MLQTLIILYEMIFSYLFSLDCKLYHHVLSMLLQDAMDLISGRYSVNRGSPSRVQHSGLESLSVSNHCFLVNNLDYSRPSPSSIEYSRIKNLTDLSSQS